MMPLCTLNDAPVKEPVPALSTMLPPLSVTLPAAGDWPATSTTPPATVREFAPKPRAVALPVCSVPPLTLMLPLKPLLLPESTSNPLPLAVSPSAAHGPGDGQLPAGGNGYAGVVAKRQRCGDGIRARHCDAGRRSVAGAQDQGARAADRRGHAPLER